MLGVDLKSNSDEFHIEAGDEKNKDDNNLEILCRHLM